MGEIVKGIVGGVKLLVSFNKDIYEIIGLSIYVSGIAMVISAIIALPLGIIIGLKKFRGRAFIIRVTNTLMGLPPVLAGLLVYLMLSRKGPLGKMELLFTPTAMIIAQTLLITPIICGMMINAVSIRGKAVYEALYTLNPKRGWLFIYLLREMKYQITGAVAAGFGRAISEVGAIMLVGGNIEHKTRVMTTFIVLQTGMGNFDRAIAVGIVLLFIAFIVNILIGKLSKES